MENDVFTELRILSMATDSPSAKSTPRAKGICQCGRGVLADTHYSLSLRPILYAERVAEPMGVSEAEHARLEQCRRRVIERIDELRASLIGLSHAIFDEPELRHAEFRAHSLLTDFLESEGLVVDRHAFGLPTAFVAEAGTSGPVVGICCEFDALPALGHACGHNIIAAAGVGAAVAVAEIAGDIAGRVRVLGTPAEEGGIGGKVAMLERGAFDGLIAALMIHPGDEDLDRMPTLAFIDLEATFVGEPSHAAAAPWDGRNALDAAVAGYVNLSLMRQQLGSSSRISIAMTNLAGAHGISVIPDRAGLFLTLRAGTTPELEALADRARAALSAAALATGTAVSFDVAPVTPAVSYDERLISLFRANAAGLGRVLISPTDSTMVASTDLGAVSELLPVIHPVLAISPAGVRIHDPRFAAHARSPRGDEAVIVGAKALALTALDLWCDTEER